MLVNELKNKEILLIVPHQDDEINIAGGLLYTLSKNNNIRVVFVTNGDYLYKTEIRYKEAINSLKKLNIPQKNIIFLGYCDQAYDQKSHMYNSDDNWISIHNNRETYGIKNINEWCYNKNHTHCLLNKENLVRDIKDIILTFYPDMIISVDLDFHPDHIMTSLCFEKAMGQILNGRGNKYYPVVLKTFAYENAYLGENDFNSINDYGMKFKIKDNISVSNTYYLESEEMCFKIDKKCYSKNLSTNPLWKAINCHKSQLLVSHAFQIMNSNYTYWGRNTRNLIYEAKVNTSSGNSNYLHDFLLCDTDNVLHGNVIPINYNKGIWMPDDKDNKKEITIEFETNKNIELIKFYKGRINDKFIKKIAISIDDEEFKTYYLSEKQYVDNIPLKRKMNKIVIKILDNVINNGFSEIELLEEYDLINLNNVGIEDTWGENFYTSSKKIKAYNITFYSNGKDDSEVEIDDTNLIRGRIKDNKLFLNNKSRGYIDFYINGEKNRIYINKNRKLRIAHTKLNKLLIKVNIFISKCIRKFFINPIYKER